MEYQKKIDELFFKIQEAIKEGNQLPMARQHEFLCDVSRYIDQEINSLNDALEM